MSSINKLREVSLKVRRCYKCGRRMHWIDFVGGNFHALPGNYFDFDMLLLIWGNPIFIIQCCWCYHAPAFAILRAE